MLATLLVAVALGGIGRADTVDDLSKQLRSDPDYKVRLSAALNLGKLGDRRGVPALVDALRDRDRTVRSVAVGALGALVDGSVAPEERARVLAALAETARGDAEAMVRDQARKVHDAILAQPPPSPPSSGVYVEVGPMADTTRRAPAVPAVMRQQVLASLARQAPQFLTRWPTGTSPSEGDLERAGALGFYVDGTLVALTVNKSAPSVSCSISLLLATYPGKSMFAFLRGGAEVETGSTSDAAVAEATSECVVAVLDDLVGSKLIPTLQQRAPR